MTRYRKLVLGAVAWVAVVTVGATLVWTVISQAGEGVAGELPTTTATSTGGQRASDRPSETRSASPSATRAASPSETGSESPSETGTSSPSGTGSASPSTSTPEQPAADPVRRTWQGAAGVVVAECRGSAIALVGAQPASGWSIEVDHTGPDGLRVEFEKGNDERVRVEASCVGGTPSFVVDSDRD